MLASSIRQMAKGFGATAAILAAPFATSYAMDAFESFYASVWVDTLVEVASDPDLVASYDADPDGVFVYRFGLGGDYAIRCKDGSVVSSVMPRGVSGEQVNLVRLCERIHKNVSQEGASGLL